MTSRDHDQAVTQGPAATPSTETAAEQARRDADTGHPLYEGAAAAVASRTPEHHRDEQVAPPALPSDSPAAADGPGISHDIDVSQNAKGAAVAPGTDRAAGAAAIPASEHHRDEQAAPPRLPSDQSAAPTRSDTDILQEATRSPENDRDGQTDTTTNDLEDKPIAASSPGDTPDRGSVADTSVASGRDSAQAIPQIPAAASGADSDADDARWDPDTGHPVDEDKGATIAAGAAGAAVIRASENHRDEQAAPPGLPSDQSAVPTRSDTDILREVTRSPENDRGEQIDTTANDLEDKPTAASFPGDTPDRSSVADTSVASGRDSAQAIPQIPAAASGADSDADDARWDPDTGHPVDKGAAIAAGAAGAAVIRASENHRDEQAAPLGLPSDQSAVPTRSDTDILREVTGSPENDRGEQTDTTANYIEDKPTAASSPGDTPDRSGVVDTSVASGRDSAQAIPQIPAAASGADSDADDARRNLDTASEHYRDERTTPPASLSDQLAAIDDPDIQHDTDVGPPATESSSSDRAGQTGTTTNGLLSELIVASPPGDIPGSSTIAGTGAVSGRDSAQDSDAENVGRDPDTWHPVDKAAATTAGAAATRASEHLSDEQATIPASPSDQPIAADSDGPGVQHNTDVGQQATSSSNDLDRQIDTTMDDLEDKPAATSPFPSGDALDHSDAASTGAVSSRDSGRFVPQGPAAIPSTDSATENVRRDEDTRYPADQGASIATGAADATATGSSELRREEQTTPSAPPSDWPSAADGMVIQHDTDEGQQVKVSLSNGRGTRTDTAPNDPDPSATWRQEEYRSPPLAPEQGVGA